MTIDVPDPIAPLMVSNSEIQTFKTCRRKWWLTYYRELALDPKYQNLDGALTLGTKIHVALEMLYSMEANPVTVVDYLYEQDFAKLGDDPMSDLAFIDLKKEQDLAHVMLEGFLVWREEEGIDHGLELVGLEEVVQVPTNVPGVALRGKMDQRWIRRVDGARLFRDWKTTQSLSDPPKILPMDEQMKFYHLLEFLDALNKTGKEPEWRTDGALYTMLRKVKRTANAKPPFYGQLEVHHNMAELRSMWLRVYRIIEEISMTRAELDRGGDPLYVCPPRPSRDCSWSCPFFMACPMFDDGSNVEGLLEERYRHVNPHERYEAEEAAIKKIDWQGKMR